MENEENDQIINILENTSPVIADLDCGEGENPDSGLDICVLTDSEANQFGERTEKPSSYFLSLGALSEDLITADTTGDVADKVEVGAIGGTDDGDGSYYVIVSRNDDSTNPDEIYFEGTVAEGGTFEAAGNFGSETFVRIFSAEGGSLLQTINFHTSCSSPLIIDDQYGSITLAGATVEGRDSGTFYTVGQTETDGDAGVVYEITGGADADDFTVDPETGEVTFISPPDFENPTDSDGDNKYDVEVTAFFVDDQGVRTGEICEVRPLEVCVEDDCINILENTSPVIADLDCGEGENPDSGLDICVLTDSEANQFGERTEKPSSYFLSLGALSEDLITADTTGDVADKVEVGAIGGTDDGDGSYYVIVSRNDDSTNPDEIYFEGTVAEGGTFEAAGNFGSETFVRIFSAEGGSLLQTINFHTSCSSPLIIDDQYGSITLAGATVEGRDSGTFYTVGQTETDGDAGVVYEITGGADADDFTVDPETGEVTFISPPDFENPTDSDGDNKYDVEVTAFFVDDQGVRTGEICEVRPLEVCVEDDCINILENTSPVIADLDCGEGENPDSGLDICVLTDSEANQFGERTEKPSSYFLSLGALSEDLITADTTGDVADKVEVGAIGGTDDGDGSYYVIVSRNDDSTNPDEIYFEGTVAEGGTFEAAGNFGSETFVRIFSAEGGSLLQTINFHTSCSSPLIIDDQYGSITLAGATVEGRDSGTFYTVGQTETDGDAGVVYEITGGADADDFTVDPETGEVTFISPPDFENPTDSDGDNKYDVEVTAFFVDDQGVRTGEICEVRPLEVCVEDELDEVCIDENTTPVVNVDLTVACPVETPRDVGLDICAARDRDVNGFGEDTDKPSAYILNLGDGLSDVIVSSQDDDKVEVISTGATDDDGTFFIRVSKDDDPTRTDELFFEGDVGFGENFTASEDAFGNSFGSKTFVHIFSEDGGELLQSVEFHTSCSQPLVIGDQYGSISLAGAELVGRDTDTVYTVGGTETTTEILGEGDIVYSIAGGADAAFFTIDPDTGELSFITAPDFEHPEDAGGDNVYDVVVRATAINDPTCFTDRPLEVCVEDVPEVGSLSGRYFCDENRNDIEDAGDTPFADKLVTLLQGGIVVATTTTDANGDYRFDNLTPGDYVVLFEDPTTEGKAFVDPDVGTDDTVDSDVTNPSAGTTDPVTVVAGEETDNVDAGVEMLPGSISGRYFVDDGPDPARDCDGLDNDFVTDPSETAVAGQRVVLIQAGVGVVARTTTDENGDYEFTGLEAGSYRVRFIEVDGFTFTEGDVGTDDTIDSDVTVIGTGGNGNTDFFDLAPGEERTDVDAGICPLGALGDTVFLDADRDGVQDAGETGVAGVTVTLTGGGEDGVIGTPDDTTETTVTDADGEYLFDGLNPGEEYQVVFSDLPEGTEFTLADQGGDDGADSDADPATGASQVVTLAPGEENRTVDAGLVLQLGALSGRYFCDENDNDVDDGEAVDPGIPGVLVTLSDAAGNVVGTTTTGAEGLYSFDGLEPGTYSVAFTDPDGVLAGKQLVAPNVGDDDTVDSDAIGDTTLATIADIVVTPGEETGDNDAGAERTASLGDTVFLDADRDGVQDAGETGVAGVTVTLTGGGEDGVIGTPDDTTETTVTDADGEYLFDGLNPGEEYQVVFSDLPEGTEFTLADQGGDDGADSDADPATGASQVVTLAPGEENRTVDAGLVLQLGALSGRYFCDENDNDVDDGEAVDPGIPGVLVTLSDAAGNVVGTTTTGAEGLYSFDGLEPGTYSVAFTDPDGVLAGKQLVAPNVGDDDTVDSDAIGDTTLATIADIVVTPGEETGDNDAGAERTASLGDTVFLDADRDGVQDAGETGVAGVTVTLTGGGEDGVIGTPDDTTETTVTDADGEYLFDGLNPGEEYQVVFSDLPEGTEFTLADQGGDDGADSDADPATGASQVVTLAPGEENRTVDAGLVLQLGALSGRYFCDENDNDVDDGEAVDPGIPGVLVTLSDAAGNVVGTTTTGAEGLYSFDGLEPGTYSVAFTDPDGVLAGKQLVAPNVGDDDTVDSDAIGDTTLATIADIVVTPGEETGDNDAGAERTASLGDTVFLDADRDGVQDAGETGVAGVTVTLTGGGEDGVIGTPDDTTETTVTDADGEYLFDGLNPGEEYQVVFSDLPEGTEFTLADQGGDDGADSDADPATGASQVVTLAPGEENRTVDAGLVLQLGALSGRYFCDENDNDVDDGEAVDPGIPGVLVTLSDAAGNVVGTTTTGAEGLYSFDGLEPGTYSVAFTDPDGVLAGKQLVAPNVGDDDTVDSDAIGDTTLATIADIVVTPGEETGDNDAGAERTASLGDTVFLDADRDGVQDAGETGVAGVTVTLTGGGEDGVIGTPDDTTETTVTDADGEYLFDGLNPGEEYQVVFSDLPEGTEFTLADQGGDDGADSDADPATGASQVVTLAPGEENRTVDAGLVLQLGALSGRYFCDENDNDVDDGEAVDPGIPGVLVTLSDAAGNVVGTTTTGAEGLYSFDGLEPGTYSVAFTDPDGVLAGKQLVAPNVGDDDTVDSDAIGDTTLATIADIVVTPGEETGDNDAGAERTASLGDTVFLDADRDGVQDAGETGVAGVTVTLTGGGEDGVIGTPDDTTETTVTDADGEYLFDGLNPGEEYQVVFSDLPEGTEFTLADQGGDDGADSDADPATGASQVVTLAPGEENRTVDAGLVLQLGALSGRYFCDENDNDVDDGEAVDPGIPGVLVTLSDAAGNVVGTTTTGAEGLYSFDGLEPGTYSVAFTDPDGVLAGKQLVAPNVGDDDTVDSDAIGDTTLATIADIVVTPGEETGDNDAGAERQFGAIDGVYFCDEDGDGVQDMGEAGIDGIAVEINGAGADGMFGTADDTQVLTTTDADGAFSAVGFAAGTYQVVAGNTTTSEFTVDLGETIDLAVGAECFRIPADGTFLGDIAETADNRAKFGFPEDGFGIGRIDYTVETPETAKLTGDILLQSVSLEDGTMTDYTPATAPVMRLDIELDSNGDIAGSDSEDLFIFNDDNGNGDVDAGEEVLLTARAVAAGLATGVALDFVFEVTGGSLQDDFDPLLGMSTFTNLDPGSKETDLFLKGYVGDLGFDCFCIEDYAFS